MMTYAETLDEARANAAEEIETWLDLGECRFTSCRVARVTMEAEISKGALDIPQHRKAPLSFRLIGKPLSREVVKE